jgi:RimJ/RimL family protein N-acetyltransferase
VIITCLTWRLEGSDREHGSASASGTLPRVATLMTSRLALREMTDADLDDMAALLGDEDVMSYYSRPKTRAEAGDWSAWNQRNYSDHGFGLWVVNLRSTGDFVGDCGLTFQHIDGVRELEVGYHVSASMQRRGYATEAAAGARDFARDVRGFRRLTAIINPRNIPSQRVAVKIGLKMEKRSVAPDGAEAVIYAAAL